MAFISGGLWRPAAESRQWPSVGRPTQLALEAAAVTMTTSVVSVSGEHIAEEEEDEEADPERADESVCLPMKQVGIVGSPCVDTVQVVTAQRTRSGDADPPVRTWWRRWRTWCRSSGGKEHPSASNSHVANNYVSVRAEEVQPLGGQVIDAHQAQDQDEEESGRGTRWTRTSSSKGPLQAADSWCSFRPRDKWLILGLLILTTAACLALLAVSLLPHFRSQGMSQSSLQLPLHQPPDSSTVEPRNAGRIRRHLQSTHFLLNEF